ncbi:cell envelope biogenesis protein OmpA [Bizionia gelidisalsuginis]|uniref:Cell envelope biogenesis protein OmpA n=2 Tax=Bizionia TaxID=283785 RepID=A0A8H2LGU8_9FLAO|nr:MULTISPECIES: cell envelope biogenesis protein OmpA [Bizionia]TYB78178.1 cell envelope biogenesis protein OmpA [Bizionia saleffrena]TYC10603.1 cell envelope biogenesis protein OmpA [Bizionia gelidisalsuginis]
MKTSNTPYCFLIVFLISATSLFAQQDTSKWRALLAIGVNSPSQSGFVADFEGNSINFPTINLGVQTLFTPQMGAKLDFGYNRFSNADKSPAFKVNYTRINAQFVYDASPHLLFLPVRMAVVGHIGPGYSIVKPLDVYGDNKVSFLNAMAGLECHYNLDETLALYLDGSYIKGFAKDFDPEMSGYGSFNGDLLTVTVGVSIALSGCRTCN